MEFLFLYWNHPIRAVNFYQCRKILFASFFVVKSISILDIIVYKVDQRTLGVFLVKNALDIFRNISKARRYIKRMFKRVLFGHLYSDNSIDVRYDTGASITSEGRMKDGIISVSFKSERLLTSQHYLNQRVAEFCDFNVHVGIVTRISYQCIYAHCEISTETPFPRSSRLTSMTQNVGGLVCVCVWQKGVLLGQSSGDLSVEVLYLSLKGALSKHVIHAIRDS